MLESTYRLKGLRPGAMHLLAALLCGCSNLAGIGGKPDFACKAPEGVKCESVSGTYHNAIQGNLPSQRRQHNHHSPTVPERAPVALPKAGLASAGGVAIAYEPQSLRSQPRVIRLWIKPWIDADQDLVDQSFVYIQADEGKWMLGHAQRHIRSVYAPLRPPPSSIAGASQVGASANGGAGAAQQDESISSGQSVLSSQRDAMKTGSNASK